VIGSGCIESEIAPEIVCNLAIIQLCEVLALVAEFLMCLTVFMIVVYRIFHGFLSLGCTLFDIFCVLHCTMSFI